MKTYGKFLEEIHKIDPEIIKEIKRNFLMEIISSGYVKPTSASDIFESFINDVIERG
jgi:hypothetical protein